MTFLPALTAGEGAVLEGGRATSRQTDNAGANPGLFWSREAAVKTGTRAMEYAAMEWCEAAAGFGR